MDGKFIIRKIPTEADLKHYKKGDPVEAGFKWMLLLGRVIGVIPVAVSLEKGRGIVDLGEFRWLSFPSFHNLFLIIISLAMFLPQLWASIQNYGEQPTILGEMAGFHDPIFRGSILVVFLYWRWRGGWALQQLFRRWSETMQKLNLEGKDPCFPQFCLTVTAMFLGMNAVENICGDCYLMGIYDEAQQGPAEGMISKLYRIDTGSLANFLPENSIPVSILFIACYRIGFLAWNYSDLFLIIMCRAVAHKFKEINEDIETALGVLTLDGHSPLLRPSGPKLESGSEMMEIVWMGVREKLLALCELAEEVTTFVGPFVLTCYAFSIWFIMYMLLTLLNESDAVVYAFMYVAIVHYTMRLVLVTYYAAGVYHSTECILRSLERHPLSMLSPTAYQLERMLARHPVGVTIFGTVPITRGTFISILSFLFSAEIILLQAMSAKK